VFLKGYNRIDLARVLAYSYDNLRNLKFVLMGSEVGVLYGFLALEDRESPLYGSAKDEIVIERFSREEAIEFLETGFAEAGVSVPRGLWRRSLMRLTGYPAGSSSTATRWSAKARLSTRQRSSKELREVARQSELYGHVLRAVALGYRRWSAIKRAAEAWMGRRIPRRVPPQEAGRNELALQGGRRVRVPRPRVQGALPRYPRRAAG